MWSADDTSSKDTKAKSLYHLTASRKSSGIDGEYPTMNAAIDRLKDYSDSFPNEVIEATITKIK